MRALGWIFYLLTGGLIVWFGSQNWTPVQLYLTPSLFVTWPLALLVVVCVLIGFLPMQVALTLTRWRLGRKLSKAEAAAKSAASSGPSAGLPQQTPPLAIPPGV